MKRITNAEYKEILVNLLVHFDKICRENSIKYSLIGGSLIGAIRHKGIIPWDDDIDVVLMPEEYDKLLNIKKQFNDDSHQFMDVDTYSDYYFNFPKLVDTRTILKEKNVKEIAGYGVYLDIFCYNYMPDDIKAIEKIYQKLRIASYLSCTSYTFAEKNDIVKRLISFFTKRISYKKWSHIKNRILHPRNAGHQYMIHNWPTYGIKKEIQLVKNFSQYVDCEFEGHKVMIAQGYDKILRTTFGDYMTPPPKDKRITHHEIEAYWKD